MTEYSTEELQNMLQKMGCSKEEIIYFFQLEQNHAACDQQKLLRKVRTRLLMEIHEKEKQVAQLDWICAEMEKNQ